MLQVLFAAEYDNEAKIHSVMILTVLLQLITFCRVFSLDVLAIRKCFHESRTIRNS